LRFVACPIYRDTDSGAKSGCWLATDPATGIRYDVSLSNIKPDWNRSVLVEGIPASDDPEACGATVLRPVRVSVLNDACTRHVLPAEGHAGRKFKLPQRHIEPLDAGYPLPAPPYSNRTFSALFSFGRTFLAYQEDDWLVDQAVTYIRASHPVKVIVTAYSDSTEQVVSGRTLAEPASLARERAEKIALALVRLGVPNSLLHVGWSSHPGDATTDLADGLRAPGRRRVDIEVVVR
jgi:hypothetical protein